MESKNNNSNVSLKTKEMEMHRLILQSLECGIKKESIGFSIHKFRELLDENYHSGNVVLLSDKLYNAGQNWCQKNIIILIDGGNQNIREIFGGACIFRFIVCNAFTSMKMAINMRMSEIITNLSTFDKSRFEFTEKLKNIPCLFIQEVDFKESPRDTNDCTSMLDAILFYRTRYNKPTLISLNQLFDEFNTPGTFGKIFGNIITSKDDDVLNIRLIKKDN